MMSDAHEDDTQLSKDQKHNLRNGIWHRIN